MHAATPFLLVQRKPRMAPAAFASAATHGIVIAALIALRYAPDRGAVIASLPETLNQGIVWLSEPGSHGGGGGGGNQRNEPARAATLPGHDPISVPARSPTSVDPSQSADDATALQQPEIPVRPLASGIDILPGVIAAPPGPTI